jgi:hypothetical protein
MPFSLQRLSKLQLLALCFLTLLGISICAAGLKTWRRPVAAAQASSASSGQVGQAAAVPKKAPVAVEPFVLAEMNLTLENASENQDRGGTQIGGVLTNQKAETLREMQVLLLDFGPDNVLERVEGHTIKANLPAGKKGNFAFFPNKPIADQHSLVLAIKAASGENTLQDLDADELVRALKNYKGKGQKPLLKTKDKMKGTGEVMPNFCYSLFHLAHDLAADQDGAPLGAFTCDQNSQSFLITFRRDSNAKK